MISYYELLGMIKEDKAPNKIKVHLTSTPKIYKKDDDIEEYCYYVIDDDEETNENYKYYLTESYLESMMFDKTIEILDEKKIPEKIRWHEVNGVGEEDDAFYVDVNGKSQYVDSEYDSWEMTTILKINEIIDYLKSKGE